MIRLLVATLLLAAIAVTVRLKSRGTGTTRAIKITGRAAVNRGAVVAIVEVEGRRLLIGASTNHVNVLADLGDADAVAAIDAPAVREVRAIRPPSDGSLVQRVRKLTVRTVDPAARPTLTGALKEGTRRAS